MTKDDDAHIVFYALMQFVCPFSISHFSPFFPFVFLWAHIMFHFWYMSKL
jgi:hypothetical protein